MSDGAGTQNQHIFPAWRGQTLDTATALNIPWRGSAPGAGWCPEGGSALPAGVNQCLLCKASQGGSPGRSLGHRLSIKKTCIWILLRLLTGFMTVGKSLLLSELSQFPRGKTGRIHELSGVRTRRDSSTRCKVQSEHSARESSPTCCGSSQFAKHLGMERIVSILKIRKLRPREAK